MNKLVLFVTAAALGSLPHPLLADGLRNAGVLGNSGEQGETLIRHGEKTASGMGVVHDQFGTLWDRAGAGVLHRYAVDGRFLGSYPIAGTHNRNHRDTLVLFDNTLLLKLGRNLYSLSITAAPGTEPEVLPVEATRISFGTHEGWAAAANDRKVFWVNAAGETREIVELDGTVEDIEVGPEGKVYVRTQGKFLRVDPEAPEELQGPFPAPGERPQWLAGHWYGHSWHGTIRRFDSTLSMSPGVVLGGASGSFIGYVEGNHELLNGRGMAHLGGNLFAASGLDGGIHLLEWQPEELRFRITRRIDAARECNTIALDSQGRIWFNGGLWNWSDAPYAPLRFTMPTSGPSGLFGASVLENDTMVVPALRHGRPILYTGKLEGPARQSRNVEEISDKLSTSTVASVNKQQQLLIVNQTGNGIAYHVGNDGRARDKAGEVKLQATTPIKKLTSLAPFGDDQLLVGADGQVIEFQTDGEVFKEQRRWRQWGDSDDAHFGDTIFLATSQDRIWISDTDRNRVLVFDADNKQPLAHFGLMDRAGSDLESLHNPQTITANGRRSLVFDSANQRLVRLELQE